MRYRVYSGPSGAERISPMEKDQLLFKEFGALDDAFAWAGHVGSTGRVALLIEGDDGTHLTKHESQAPCVTAMGHPRSRINATTR